MTVQRSALPDGPIDDAHPCHCGGALCLCRVSAERLRRYVRAIVGVHHPVGTVAGYQQCACGTPFCSYLAHARHYLS